MSDDRPAPPAADEADIRNALRRLLPVRDWRDLKEGGEEEGALLSTAQTIELRDPFTRGHCDRVAGYALRIAVDLHLAEETLRSIRYGGWLHDCGKIGVPESVLVFPGKLSEEDFELVKRHPVWGAEAGREARLPPEVVDIIRSHHERYDGRGYPAGAAGETIPLSARIVAVADVFDAITTDRPYAKGYDREEAFRILGVLRGAVLDPRLVDLFLDSLRREPLR